MATPALWLDEGVHYGEGNGSDYDVKVKYSYILCIKWWQLFPSEGGFRKYILHSMGFNAFKYFYHSRCITLLCKITKF